MQIIDPDKRPFYQKLKDLYDFVKWLRLNGFKNRKERKSFFQAVIQDKPVMEELLLTILGRYQKDDNA